MSRQPPLPSGPPPTDFYRPNPGRYEDNRYDNNYPPAPGTSGRNNSTFQFQANVSLPPIARSSGSYRDQQSNDQYRGDHYAGGPSYRDRGDQYGNGSYRDQSSRYSREPAYAKQDSYRPSHGEMQDSYRPPQDKMQDSYRPLQGDFTFRQDAPKSIIEYSRQQHDYQPRQPRSNNRPSDRRDGYNHRESNPQAPSRGRGGYRGRGGPRRAADRPMLQTKREPTPELMKGMVDSNDTETAKFRSLDDLSDSDEEDMDLSSNKVDAPHDGEASEEPRAKVAKISSSKAADGDSAPRWSNPDPYTALPPPDESQGPKRDILKMIRKSKVESSSKDASKSKAVTDDFISFDFDEQDDENDKPSNEQQSGERNTDSYSGNGMPGAPTGPRDPMSGQQSSTVPFSHLKSLHGGSTATNDETTSVPENKRSGKVNFELDKSSDPALGSRKRTVDDQIKYDRPIEDHSSGRQPQRQLSRMPRNGKQNSLSRVVGHITPQWLFRRTDEQPTPSPWCTVDHSRTTNMGLWLHKEIVDFYEYVKPRAFEEKIRASLVQRLRTDIANAPKWRDADIHSFGSFPAGLYLPTSDMDLVLISSNFARSGITKYGKNIPFQFGDFIRGRRLAEDRSMEIISKAKVPLVKYVDGETGLKVDISFENTTGIVAIGTFKAWKEQYPAMPIIVTIIKHFLAMRGLNEPVNGGIGGFSVICLVVSLLQNLPSVQSGNLVPEHHLNEILMEFFNLYGNDFDASKTAIYLNPSGYVQKSLANVVYRQNNLSRLSIIDPNNSANDISGGSGRTNEILDSFSQAYAALTRRMGELHHMDLEERRGQSILEVILGGNYSSFKEQRDHLARLHQRLR